MAIRRVSKLEFDGSTISITIGRTEIRHVGFTYGDNLKQEWVREMGSQIATAQTPGAYETTEGKLKMRSSIAREFLFPLLPQFGAGNVITQCVSNFVHPDLGSDSDLLEDFRLLGTASSLEASAKALELEFTCSYRLIKWTNRRICWGNPQGSLGAFGVSRL